MMSVEKYFQFYFNNNGSNWWWRDIKYGDYDQQQQEEEFSLTDFDVVVLVFATLVSVYFIYKLIRPVLEMLFSMVLYTFVSIIALVLVDWFIYRSTGSPRIIPWVVKQIRSSRLLGRIPALSLVLDLIIILLP